MYDAILVALDGSDTASRAFDAALDLARLTGANLQSIYVIDIPAIAFDASGFDPSIVRTALVDEGNRLSADARERMKQAGVSGSTRLVETSAVLADDVADCIQRVAREIGAGLIVMGTHGRRGVRRLMLGSVAERVLRGAPCPVLLVPASATQMGVTHAARAVDTPAT